MTLPNTASKFISYWKQWYRGSRSHYLISIQSENAINRWVIHLFDCKFKWQIHYQSPPEVAWAHWAERDPPPKIQELPRVYKDRQVSYGWHSLGLNDLQERTKKKTGTYPRSIPRKKEISSHWKHLLETLSLQKDYLWRNYLVRCLSPPLCNCIVLYLVVFILPSRRYWPVLLEKWLLVCPDLHLVKQFSLRHSWKFINCKNSAEIKKKIKNRT